MIQGANARARRTCSKAFATTTFAILACYGRDVNWSLCATENTNLNLHRLAVLFTFFINGMV